MNNDNEPVKPAIVPTDTRTIISIGSHDYQLDPRVEIDSAIWMMRLLSLGTCETQTEWDPINKITVRTAGPREIIALALTPAESEVAK